MSISTSWDKRQPRLLVICVDVADGKTVTFDSYHKQQAEDHKNPLYESDGISIDHVMASGTLPIFYDFRDIGGRQFCDGGLLSNTPFRELLQAHQDYWSGKIDKDTQKIPDLDVYIVNVRPSTGSLIDKDDHDAAKDRINDITFFDRNSDYDENAFAMTTDCMAIIDRLKALAENHIGKDKSGAFNDDFENFLNTTKAKSKSITNKTRTHKDLLRGRFKLTNVKRIEPKAYEDSIYGKGADFTSKTIRDLIDKGRRDALYMLEGDGNNT